MNRRDKYINETPAQRRYRAGRNNLLLILIFGAVNLVMTSVGGDIYFLFSNYGALLLGAIGRELYLLSGDIVYLLIFVGFALLVLLPYLLCWIFSKKHGGWLWAAAILFTIDTGLVVWFGFTEVETSMIADLVFHIWAAVSLYIGAANCKKALAGEGGEFDGIVKPDRFDDIEDTVFYDASIPNNTPSLGEPQSARKFRVLVSAEHGGDHIEVRRSYGLTELVVNGRLYGQRKGVTETEYEISARVGGREIATRMTLGGKQTIEVDGEVIAQKQRLF